MPFINRSWSSGAVATWLVAMALLPPASPHASAQPAAQVTLARETSATVAEIRREVLQAEARWRREFAGKIRNRAGAPLPESEVMADIRRALQTLDRADARLPAIAADFDQLRLTAAAYGNQLDALFEEAVVTGWDVHLTEARRSVEVAQQNAGTERDALREKWAGIVAGIAARPGLSAAQRQQLIDAAAPPIRDEERRQVEAVTTQLDAIARTLALQRQRLRDAVNARAQAARAAKRPGAPERLSGIVEAHLESVGPSGGAFASSLDQLLASVRITLAGVVDGAPSDLGLAERIAPMLATRLASDPVDATSWYPESPERPAQIVLKVDAMYPGRTPQDTWKRVLGDAAKGWGADDRLLVVYGLNLFEYGTPSGIDSSDPEITYTLLDTTAPSANAAASRVFEDAWGSARMRLLNLDGADRDAFDVADAALVRAHLEPGAARGLKRFRLSPLEVEWLEDDGNVMADVDFVRQLGPEEAEALDTIFLHDRFRVRAVVNARTSLDEIECVVFRDGKPWEINGRKSLRLKRAGYDPRVYHSEIFRVTPGPGVPAAAGVTDTPLPMNTTLTAMIPRLAPVTMRLPANARIETTPNQVHSQWKAWLARAATLAGRRIDDFDRLSEETLGSIPHVHLTAPNRKIEIQLGDYAAMLLLRDAYLRQITPVRDEFRKLHDSLASDPEALSSFYELARIAIANPGHPLGNIQVTEVALGNPLLTTTVPFRNAFDPKYLFSRAWSGDGQRQWIRAATREAFDIYMAALDSAVDTAGKVDERNAIRLLELTGLGFSNVAERLRPNMLRLREGPEGLTWEPDPIARSRLRGVQTIADDHFANRDLSKAESDVVLTAASLVAFAPNVVLLRTMSLAMSIAFVEKAFLVDLPSYFRSRADLEFATGAFAVLGPERMAIAEANRVSGFTTALSVIGSTVGLGGDFIRYVQTVNAADAAAAMPAVLAKLKTNGFAEFGQLSTEHKAAYSALLAEARVAAARPGGASTLSQLHSDILAADRQIALRLRAAERWRTYHVSSEVRSRVATRAVASEPAPNPAASARPAPRVPDTPEIVTARTRGELLTPHQSVVPARFPGAAGGTLQAANGEIQIGRRLGVGNEAVVYELSRADAVRLANWLSPGERLPEGDFVIKLMKESSRATPGEIVERQQMIEGLLVQHRVPHLRLVGGDPDAAIPYVIQERIPNGGRIFDYQGSIRPATDWGETAASPDLYAFIRGGRMPRPHQEALLRLYRDIARQGLIWEDGHLGNVCFLERNGTVEAMVIDHGRFVPWAANFRDPQFDLLDRLDFIYSIPPGMAPGGHRPSRIHSIDWATMPDAEHLLTQGRHVYPNAEFFMAKMLEYDGRYIRFNPTSGEWTGKHLDLDLVRKYFPNFENWRTVPAQ